MIPEYYKDDFILIFDLGKRKYRRHFETLHDCLVYLDSDSSPSAPYELRHVVSTLLFFNSDRNSVRGDTDV